MGATRQTWMGFCVIALACYIRETSNEPQYFNHGFQHSPFSGYTSGYGLPQYPSAYIPTSYPLTSTYGTPATERTTATTSFIGYGPNYFDALPNFGGNLEQRQCGPTATACRPSKYRTIDGTCNNERKPTWGAANTLYGRLIDAKYADGVSSPPVSVTGLALPESRRLSLSLFPDRDNADPIWTLAAMQWGQIVTHDMSIAVGTTQSHAHPTQCCSRDGRQEAPIETRAPSCLPIVIPPEDPLHKQLGQRCMNFVRSTTDRDNGCAPPGKPAEQVVGVTHWMDTSLLYGSDDQLASSLRTFQNGQLRVDIRNGQSWPPQNANSSLVCEGQTPQESCYQTGDLRANQNPQLTIFQIILLREHNRIAAKLSEINPHWNDETLYQEARRIVIGEFQHISYYEWLPIFLGWKNLLSHGVVYKAPNAYVNDYNDKINPSVLNEHANAAFRYFHSNIQGFLSLVSDDRFTKGALRLSDTFNAPALLERSNNFDDLTRGMASQPQQSADKFHTSEITDFLFRNQMKFGADLKAIDIQRGRDHGLASYNDYRTFCGLPRAHNFEDFSDVIDIPIIEKLKRMYAHPDDVDLTVGGSFERHVPGSLSGPTFLCIMTEQFYRTRVSDKHFYEHGDHPGAFTPEQLTEIRRSSMARLMCDNTENVFSMQPRAFERISPKNPVVVCHDYHAIPAVNLELWREGRAVPGKYQSYFLTKK